MSIEVGLEVRLVENNTVPRTWSIEAVGPDWGDFERAVFSGPGSEVRAREYGLWRYPGIVLVERRL